MPVKIDRQIADEVRARFARGEPGKVIAHSVGIAKSTVSMIVNNRIWKTEGATEDETHHQ